eukprot:5392466-Pyramimonas_sp.AAC.1
MSSASCLGVLVGFVSCSNIAIAVGRNGEALRTTNSAQEGYTEWLPIVIGDITIPSGLAGEYLIRQQNYDFQAVS